LKPVVLEILRHVYKETSNLDGELHELSDELKWFWEGTARPEWLDEQIDERIRKSRGYMSEEILSCACEECKKYHVVTLWKHQEWVEEEMDKGDEFKDKYEILCPECQRPMKKRDYSFYESGESFFIDEIEVSCMLENGINKGHGWRKNEGC
jgi:uncharacterized CHY-type Zn-finger protein